MYFYYYLASRGSVEFSLNLSIIAILRCYVLCYVHSHTVEGIYKRFADVNYEQICALAEQLSSKRRWLSMRKLRYGAIAQKQRPHAL